MLSADQCTVRLTYLDEEGKALDRSRIAKHAEIEQWFLRATARLHEHRDRLIVERDRLTARAATPRVAPSATGPFVLQQLGTYLCADDQWRASPDEAQLRRFAYRGNAERAATGYHQDTTVLTWEAYLIAQQQQRYRAAETAATPKDPGPAATDAEWEQYWANADAAWERQRKGGA